MELETSMSGFAHPPFKGPTGGVSSNRAVLDLCGHGPDPNTRAFCARILHAHARKGRSMGKITDKTGSVRPNDEDEGIWLDNLEVHLVTHPAGQIKEMHVHDPPQDHVITIRSGRMRWTVEGESLDAGPGDVIVTPAGVAHSYI